MQQSSDFAVHAWPPGAAGLDGYRLLLLDAVAAFRAFGPRLQGDRKLKTAHCQGLHLLQPSWKEKGLKH